MYIRKNIDNNTRIFRSCGYLYTSYYQYNNYYHTKYYEFSNISLAANNRNIGYMRKQDGYFLSIYYDWWRNRDEGVYLAITKRINGVYIKLSRRSFIDIDYKYLRHIDKVEDLPDEISKKIINIFEKSYNVVINDILCGNVQR